MPTASGGDRPGMKVEVTPPSKGCTDGPDFVGLDKDERRLGEDVEGEIEVADDCVAWTVVEEFILVFVVVLLLTEVKEVLPVDGLVGKGEERDPFPLATEDGLAPFETGSDALFRLKVGVILLLEVVSL